MHHFADGAGGGDWSSREEFRLHIIANSADSRADQEVKLLVRDELLTYSAWKGMENSGAICPGAYGGSWK